MLVEGPSIDGSLYKSLNEYWSPVTDPPSLNGFEMKSDAASGLGFPNLDLIFSTSEPFNLPTVSDKVTFPDPDSLTGTKGAYINQISGFYNSENELLLARNTTLRITEILPPAIDTNGNDKIVVKCVII